MMQPADMQSLPEELVEMIAHRLSVRDLTRCCTVSRSWREIFGQDRLWQPHCEVDLADYLAGCKSRVKPRFVSPETNESTLSEIGTWRLCYMRQTHLRNNWNKGNYQECRGFYNDSDLDYVFKRIFYKKNYILEFKEEKIVVWDVRRIPVVYGDIPYQLSANPEIGVFEVIGSNKIVVLQDTLVVVYSLNLKRKSLRVVHMFLFQTSEKLAGTDEELYDLIVEERKYVRVECTVVRNILVGIVKEEKPLRVHIWNVETGEKLKEQSFPCSDSLTISSFSQNNKTLNILFDLGEEIDEQTIVHHYVYNLTMLAFYPFHIKHQIRNVYRTYLSQEFYSILCDKFVAIWVNNTLYVYNLLSELIYTHDYPCEASLYRSLWCSQDNIIVKMDSVISVVNPHSKSVEAQFCLRKYNQPLTNVINGRAIAVYKINKTKVYIGLEQEGGDKDKGCVSIPLYYFTTAILLLVNNYGTKVMLKEDKNMVVVNFW
ncbi:uncharacterized protein LOC124365828 [Homalodisca vitripennis]|uniref:uncharacterized protein LOC124365828 n=1 Tax=Homalodisca vitripennis TaxID=197043 RepID=UPI001EEB861B|nr:uncharacterized protein LOC124365828 [Homalodisca vitripennis]KAG8246747.1 hypothetical protein J6590_077699 [Homalodisca vitripennis]KAG8265564.1 hypothetical protein J6590_092214 [Homalodisca vitripennis]